MIPFAAMASTTIRRSPRILGTIRRRRGGLEKQQQQQQQQQQRHYHDDKKTPAAIVMGCKSNPFAVSMTRELRNRDIKVLGVDTTTTSSSTRLQKNDYVDRFCLLTPNTNTSTNNYCSLEEMIVQLENAWIDFVRQQEKGVLLEAVVCCPTTNVDTKNKNHPSSSPALHYARSLQETWQRELVPAHAALYMGQQYMSSHNDDDDDDDDDKSGGLLVIQSSMTGLTTTSAGSSSAAAVQHAIQTLGASCGRTSMVTTAVRKRGRSLRKQLPALDQLTVTGLLWPAAHGDDDDAQFMMIDENKVARQVASWIEQPSLRPHSGSLLSVYSRDDEPVLELVG